MILKKNVKGKDEILYNIDFNSKIPCLILICIYKLAFIFNFTAVKLQLKSDTICFPFPRKYPR